MARANDGPIGWVLLSREAVARAEEALSPDDRGVRDEVGFLALHQGFANRFFPGTSVLHTRLRYVLFVPWLMKRVAAKGGRDNLQRRLAAAETALAGQLRIHEDSGVIGSRVWPRAASQLPSMMYWNALRAWGILRTYRDGSAPSRGDSLRRIARQPERQQRATDDESMPLEDGSGLPFVTLPEEPEGLGVTGQPLRFALEGDEPEFLRRHLLTARRNDDTASLLAQLVEAGTGHEATNPWDSKIVGLADSEDQVALRVARRASALAGVGRAVYAALVEAAHAKDRLAESDTHRARLNELVIELGDEARSFDPTMLSGLLPKLPANLVQVLSETRDWLNSGSTNPIKLREVYEVAERSRKGDRARLPETVGGRRRRAEWAPQDHPLAKPLRYRWDNVRQLLQDLHAR